jgi:hypothetical protein
MSDEGFISRWSRKKTASKAGPDRPTADAVPAQAGIQSPDPAPPPEPLPPIESLTPDSDFTPFMKPEVDADTKRKAVKMLFQDPRYNVMDGLDVYIDDYSKPDPLPEGWLEKMTQMSRLGEYVDPDRVKPEPDKENAAKTALQDEQQAAAIEENGAREQALAAPPPQAPADTSDAGSPDAKVKELGPST